MFNWLHCSLHAGIAVEGMLEVLILKGVISLKNGPGLGLTLI